MPFARKSSDVAGGAGGTCVLCGCVPKKLMVYGGEFAQAFKDSVGFGCASPLSTAVLLCTELHLALLSAAHCSHAS